MRKKIVVLCGLIYNVFVWCRGCTAFAYMDFTCLLRKTPFGAAYTGGSEDIMYTYLVRRQCGQIKKHYEKGEVSPMNNLKEQKLNNKGFSLVELIIVIAIMAVLIGVLAPQYLKYVEKSRQSADLDTVDSMVSAIEIYSADPANNIVSGTITCNASGDVTADADTLAALQDAGLAASTATTATVLTTMKSNAYKDWTITFGTDSNNNPVVTFGGNNGGDLGTAMGRN